MFSKFGFHHFIFALLPVCLLFLDNIHELAVRDIFIPIIISLVIVTIPWILLLFSFGEKKSALVISFGIILLLVFSYTRSSLIDHDITELQFIAKNIILIPIFLSVGIFGIIFILRRKLSTNITSITNVVSISVIGFMIFQSGLFYLENDVLFDESQKLMNVPIIQASESGQKPDVYLLLLDAYSGDITLKNDFKYDNSGFYTQLEERGFFVQKESFSNYPNTELSMPSIMNMHYLDFLPELQGEESRDMRLAQKLWNYNKAMQVFDANGYEIYSFYGSGPIHSLITKNFCEYAFNSNPELNYALVNTYIPISSIRNSFLDNQHYDNVTCVFDTMMDFENTTDKPFYMHMHIRFPHPPLVFDSEGNRVNEPISSHRFDSELKDAYLQQLIFANKKTLEIIDSIKQKNPSAVIILMSDHGGRFGINWNNPSEMDYFRGFNTLTALYFPEKESHFPTHVSPVNVFRVFFNLYLETDYEILDEKHIWYEPGTPFKQTNVTEIVKSSSFRN